MCFTLGVAAVGKNKVAVIIPCYKTKSKILEVIMKIGSEVQLIVVVDDKCPEETGSYVQSRASDPRVVVLFHEVNKGVGGSTKTGYKYAIQAGAEIIFKLDGDGQMDPSLIPMFLDTLVADQSDYVTGNRFWSINHVKQMPKIRLFGNLLLSFFAKVSTGYWNLFDPNNGFTAIRRQSLLNLPLELIDDRYFFESDILFRLYLNNAKISQIAMYAKYEDEESNLKIYKILLEFSFKHIRNLMKRIIYTYFLRDFSIATLNLVFGSVLMSFGTVRGLFAWSHSLNSQIPTQTGTQVLVAMTILSGLQMLLSFANVDVERARRF